MSNRSEIVEIIEDTCIVCREAKIKQIYGGLEIKLGLSDENRTQVENRLYGVCEKCLEMDDVNDIFDALMTFYKFLYIEIYDIGPGKYLR
jgi:hypothetical protein